VTFVSICYEIWAENYPVEWKYCGLS